MKCGHQEILGSDSWEVRAGEGGEMKDKVHEYLRRMELAHSMGLIGKDCLLYAIIAHDDYCDIKQHGYCKCDPDITIKTDRGM